ncbi:heparanase-like [Rhyzopertha dominica]|nr:heparanase-like [Rhyzopertha dominica]
MVLIERRHDRFREYKDILKKCQSCCTTIVLIVCIVLLVLSILAVAFRPVQRIISVVLVDTESGPLYVTDNKYLSLAIDSSVIADGFRNFDMTDPKLSKLMSALAPGYLRIGGTMADRLIFVENKNFAFKTSFHLEIDGGACAFEDIRCDVFLRPNFTMSGQEWLQLNKLTAASGLTILFDLNCLTRNDDGTWNSSNAEEIIAFSDRYNLSVIWELGNEPNAFRHVFNYEVNATQLAHDFQTLRSILNKYPRYNNSLLVGPDTTRPLPKHRESQVYLKNFLESAGQIVDAVTWHQYYFNGRTASALDFIDADVFNLLEGQITRAKQIIQSTGTNKPIWLGETSSAYGGGAPGYSNRFISSFIWLDKLGLAAKNGISLVIRQSFFKGYYALIDDNYNPNPDWWVSVLYKTLVGPEVVSCDSASDKRVRLYCHCTNAKMMYDSLSSLTIFGINVKETDAKIRLEGILPPDEAEKYPQSAFAYVITTEFSLLSRSVYLNGEALILGRNGNLPPFKPKVVSTHPYLIMPPYSLVFWIVHVPVKYCTRH